MSHKINGKMQRYLTIDEKREHLKRLRKSKEDGSFDEELTELVDTINEGIGMCTMMSYAKFDGWRDGDFLHVDGFVDVRFSELVMREFERTVGRLINTDGYNFKAHKEYGLYAGGTNEVVRVFIPSIDHNEDVLEHGIEGVLAYFETLRGRCNDLRERQVRDACLNLGLAVQERKSDGAWYVDVSLDRYVTGQRLRQELAPHYNVNFMSGDTPIRIVALG